MMNKSTLLKPIKHQFANSHISTCFTCIVNCSSHCVGACENGKRVLRTLKSNKVSGVQISAESYCQSDPHFEQQTKYTHRERPLSAFGVDWPLFVPSEYIRRQFESHYETNVSITPQKQLRRCWVPHVFMYACTIYLWWIHYAHRSPPRIIRLVHNLMVIAPIFAWEGGNFQLCDSLSSLFCQLIRVSINIILSQIAIAKCGAKAARRLIYTWNENITLSSIPTRALIVVT